jgi:hypothetical protein
VGYVSSYESKICHSNFDLGITSVKKEIPNPKRKMLRFPPLQKAIRSPDFMTMASNHPSNIRCFRLYHPMATVFPENFCVALTKRIGHSEIQALTRL